MTRTGNSADLPQGYALLLRLFSVIARRRLRKAFRAVRMLHTDRLRALPPGPLVIYMNHPSWWDPLVCIAVARKLLPRRMHRAPISAMALQQYGFFRQLGAFPVEQHSMRGAAQFSRASQAVLKRGGVLWITAEGHFTDSRTRPTHLMPGLGALLQRSENVTAIPMALEYTFWNQRLPEVLAAFGKPLYITRVRERSAAEWTDALEANLQAAQDELALLSQRRDPSPFTTLLEGRKGTSGCYGVWQRARAYFGGKRYQPDHAAPGHAADVPAEICRPVRKVSR